MELKFKQLKLLMEFLKNKVLSIEEIETLMNIKKRSVYLYIEELNLFLKYAKLPLIQRFLNYGFSLECDSEEVNNFLQKHDMYFYNEKERIKIACLNLILNNKLKLSEITNNFKIDLKTAKKDLVKVVDYLLKNQIKSNLENDYLILEKTNDYINVYSLLAKIIITNKNYTTKFLNKNLSNKINSLLLLIQKILNMNWTYNFEQFLITFFQMLIIEFKNNVSNLVFQINLKLKNKKEIKKLLICFFDEQDVKINDHQLNYLIALLMCGTMINSQNIETIFPYQTLFIGCQKFIDYFEKNTFLKINNKDSLISDLIKHLIPCYYRSLIKIESFLQEIPDIENKYNRYFDIVKQGLKYIEEKLKINFYKIEITYIILHVIANVYANINRHKISIGLFCSHPISIYKLIENTLYEEFNDQITIKKIDDMQNINMGNFDLILSTSIIKNKNINNVLYIKKFVDNFDIVKIKEKIKIIKNQKNIAEKIIFSKPKNILNIRDLITKLSEPFLNDFINEKYIESLIDNFEHNAYNMILSKNIIILHANPSRGVIKKGFAINVADIKNLDYKVINIRIKYFILVVPSPTLEHLNPIVKITNLIKKNVSFEQIKKEIENGKNS